MSLDDAISVLEAEVAAFRPGTRDSPSNGTPEYFVLRAKSVGLSMLRQMKANDLAPRTADDNRAELYYKSISKAAKFGLVE